MRRPPFVVATSVLAAAGFSVAAVMGPGGAPDPSVIRSRVVAVDVRKLPDPRDASRAAAEAPITLDLFPGLAIRAAFDRFDANTTNVTWVGHVEGVAGSSVTLVYGNRLMHGSVVMPEGAFQIRPAREEERSGDPSPSGEPHVISQIDQSALPREAEPLVPALSPEAIESARDVVKTDTGDTIDVLVVYTPLAQQAAGGGTGIINLINLGISETNSTYANSDVRQRVRLVGTGLVSYTEVSSFSTNLTDLRVGAVPGVASLREQLRADLVMMLVHPSRPDACGIAYVMTSVSSAFAPFGYSVTDTSCVSPGLTVAHEWGHNMGAQHDWYVNASRLPFTYAHGYANTRPGHRWRTVMSYDDVCRAQGFSCTRLLAWANPDARLNPFCAAGGFACRSSLWFLPGDGMGVPAGTRSNCAVGVLTANECDADDHRTLNDTASTVANFRQAAVSAGSPQQ